MLSMRVCVCAVCVWSNKIVLRQPWLEGLFVKYVCGYVYVCVVKSDCTAPTLVGGPLGQVLCMYVCVYVWSKSNQTAPRLPWLEGFSVKYVGMCVCTCV